MSQITTYFQPNGPGSGTVTSVSGGTGINITGVATVNPTVNLDVPVTVDHGGTGAITFTPYAVICAGITATGAFQNVSGLGTSGYILTSNGAGALPTWQVNSGATAAVTFHTDSGDATTSSNAITIHGTHGINTSGSAATVTVAINNAITLGDLSSIIGSPAVTLTTGDLTLTAGNINLPITSVAGDEGVITVGGTRFLSSYSVGAPENIYLGLASGNFLGGAGNIGIGVNCLQNVNGSYNIFLGNSIYGTSQSLTSGARNIALGSQALWQATTCNDNIALGYRAMEILSTGSTNIAIGAGSLSTLDTGGQNIGTGDLALSSLESGSYNIAIGLNAGQNLGSNDSSNIIIGNIADFGDNHTIRIGTSGGSAGEQSKCFIAGITGVTTSNSQSVTIDSTTGQLGVASIVTPFAWTVITADQTAAVNNGYICNKAGLLTITLPTTSAVGDIIEVTGMNTALGWAIAQNASQVIHFGSSDTTPGITGSLASTLTYDSVKIVCNVADLEWIVTSSIGNITVN